MTQKANLRSFYLSLRGTLSPDRQKEAALKLYNKVIEETQGLVLSFSSFKFEIDLEALNQSLATQGRLVLPKRSGNSLQFYLVHDLYSEMQTTSFGLKEPIERLKLISLRDIKTALIPGLAFDRHNYRLGYGKGYYDRAITHNLYTIGVGYKEQLHPESLPTDSWDVPLSELLLT